MVLNLCSTTHVGLALSSFKQTRFLSLHTARVVPQQTQVFKHCSRVDIISLNRIGDCWHTSFALPSGATASDINLNVEQARVVCDCKRQQNALSL